jgi:predicted regulator of Ras-like GTPase activity (Roadblock/LC7/MglB family)
MPTIRDVLRALSDREGVDAAIVLSRDGLTIDAHVADGLDPDGLAALVPSVVSACTQLGAASERGGFGMGLIECAEGMMLVAEISDDALLAMFFAPGTNVGSHLYEVQRHRPAIADLL